jgi:hypothetical protein
MFGIKTRVHGMLEARQRARLFGELAPMVPPVHMMFDGPHGIQIFNSSKSMCTTSTITRIQGVGIPFLNSG